MSMFRFEVQMCDGSWQSPGKLAVYDATARSFSYPTYFTREECEQVANGHYAGCPTRILVVDDFAAELREAFAKQISTPNAPATLAEVDRDIRWAIARVEAMNIAEYSRRELAELCLDGMQPVPGVDAWCKQVVAEFEEDSDNQSPEGWLRLLVD
jgi:hypothetical protein